MSFVVMREYCDSRYPCGSSVGPIFAITLMLLFITNKLVLILLQRLGIDVADFYYYR